MRTVIALIALLLFSGGAAAQSCSALRAQLASAQSGGGGAALAKLNQQARAFGCNRSARWGQHRACAGIMAQINRAKRGGRDTARVRRLKRQIDRRCNQARQQRASREQSTRQRPNRRGELPPRRLHSSPNSDRIIHGTRPNNGLDQRARTNSFFGNLFGNNRRIRTVAVDPDSALEQLNVDGSSRTTGSYTTPLATRGSRRKGSSRVGSYRTVCVRLCDGFYFPINSRSHSDNFYDENAMCVGRCPGADVSLYVHHSSNPVETMRSALTGEAYTKLPTAFDYRKKHVGGGCGCRPATTIAGDLDASRILGTAGLASTADGQDDTAEAAAVTARATRPSTKPGGWQRYEAVYDGTGEPLELFVASELQAPPTATALALSAASAARARAQAATAQTLVLGEDEAVREVGPAFLSGDEAAPEPVLAGLGERLPGVRRRATSTAVSVVPLPDAPDAATTPPAVEEEQAVAPTDEDETSGEQAQLATMPETNT